MIAGGTLVLGLTLVYFIFRKTFMLHAYNVAFLLAIVALVVGGMIPIYGVKSFFVVAPIVTVVFISLFISLRRFVARPIVQIMEVLRSVSEGDLTVRPEEKLLSTRNEIGELSSYVETLVLSLAKALNEVQRATEFINHASDQFRTESEMLARGANDQAASAEEISASMEEMAANIDQNLERTREGARIGSNVSEELEEVNEAFDRTSAAMERIREKTGIVIDIAHRTNILAINAAIEAARAGQLGRGFAVVAAEVRRLADQSQEASNEIEMISNESIRAVGEMGEKIAQSAPNIRRTLALMNEIAAASQEQATGSDQINTALNQLAHVTSENSTEAENLRAGAMKLVETAENLEQTNSFFKLR